MSTSAPLSRGLLEARQRDVAEYASRATALAAFRARRQPRASVYDGVSVRVAQPGDPAVKRLAALDESPVPEGRTIVAERDGRALAAVPIADGEAVADPFERTAAIVEVLRADTRRVRDRAGRRGVRRRAARRQPVAIAHGA